MAMTPLPDPPNRSQPTNFSAEADTFLNALPVFVTEANILGSQASIDAVTASDAAIESVQASVTAVSTTASVKWISGTTYSIGNAVWSPSNSLVYRRKTNGAGTTDPMSDPTNWEQLVKTQMVRSGRSSNTILTITDNRGLIDITSGTFTQTFASCASLGSGWAIYIRNGGTGDITLDPNASETIDGLTSFVMYPGEVRIIQCDGTVLRSIVINGFVKASATSFTFVKPPGYSKLSVKLFGGGGGGGGSIRYPVVNNRCGGGGGGGGGVAIQDFAATAFPASVLVNVGAGGSAGLKAPDDYNVASAGGTGGTTTVTGLLQAVGGYGGGGGSSATTSSAGTGADSYPRNFFTQASFISGGGGAASVGSAAVSISNYPMTGGGGGGGGGGALANATTARDGGDGASVSYLGTAPGVAAAIAGSLGGRTTGALPVVGLAGTSEKPGLGGGGGAYITAQNGMDGATGGLPAGGGGGAGAADAGYIAANGGLGGGGYARIKGVI